MKRLKKLAALALALCLLLTAVSGLADGYYAGSEVQYTDLFEVAEPVKAYVGEDGMLHLAGRTGPVSEGKVKRVLCADEDNVYYYSDNHAQHEARQLQDYMEEDEINAISDEQLQEMERQKTSLFEALTKAFEEAGITVSIDMSLGEIALDNSVLFAGDSSEITSEGKAFLKKFVNVYSSVVFGEEYAGKIERIVIEGHTAPLSNSTYESGLPLSRERANNVKECCISDEMDLPDTVSGVFRDSLETRGMSNLRPVYDADGNINLDACRRVSFVFVINTDSL